MKRACILLVVAILAGLSACNLITGARTEIPGGIDPEARTVGEYVHGLNVPVSEAGLKELQSAVDGILTPLPLPKSLPGDYQIRRVISRESGIIAKGIKVPEINFVLAESEIAGELDPETFHRVNDFQNLWPEIFATIGHRGIVLTIYYWGGYPVPSSYCYDSFMPSPEDNYLAEYLGIATGDTEKVGDTDVWLMSYGDTTWAEWRLPDWESPQFVIRATPGKEVSNEDFREVIAAIKLPEPELLLPYGAGIYDADGLFPDPNLKSYILDLPDITGPLQPEDVASIEEIHARGRNIVSLDGLEYCTNLKVLDLEDNNVSDLSPLAGLSNLIEVNLTGNGITDVTPLAGLKDLEKIELGRNRITDVSPLASLTGLEYLDLGWNEIEDISPLSRLTGLTHLDIGINNIEDISPLSGLDGLGYLYLNYNHILVLSPLSGLTGLESLYVGDNLIEDISPLSGLTQLHSLGLYHNRIADVTGLTGLERLEYLDLRVNRIGDLTPFNGASLPELQRIDLNYNYISDASPLTGADLPKLEIITLEGNRLSAEEISEVKDALKPENRPSPISPEVPEESSSGTDEINTPVPYTVEVGEAEDADISSDEDTFDYDNAFGFRAKRVTLEEAADIIGVKVPVPTYLPEGFDIQHTYIGVSDKTVIFLIFNRPLEQREVEPPDEPKDYPIRYVESPETQMYTLHIFFDGGFPPIEETTPGVNLKINDNWAVGVFDDSCEQDVISWSMEIAPEDSGLARSVALRLIALQKSDDSDTLIKIAESIRQ